MTNAVRVIEQSAGERVAETVVGRRAVVTGAGSGIGYAIANLLVSNGAQVVALSRSGKAPAGVVTSLQCDLRNQQQFRSVADQALNTLGGLDIVVHAAGIKHEEMRFTELTWEDWHDCMATNLDAFFLLSQWGAPVLKQAGGGKILAIGSGVSRRAPERSAAYVASKAGLSAVIRVMAKELRTESIAVNELQPGLTATAIHDGSQAEMEDAFSRLGPLVNRLQGSEWHKSPQAVAGFALELLKFPNNGPSGQIFSLNKPY